MPCICIFARASFDGAACDFLRGSGTGKNASMVATAVGNVDVSMLQHEEIDTRFKTALGGFWSGLRIAHSWALSHFM